MTIIHTTWHGMAALGLESDALRVLALPELGGKIVSLYDKRHGYEWLVGSDGRPVRPVDYGADFVTQDMSGWDECLPSIKPCRYPVAGVYHGREIPDHGEVWALPWTVAAADERLTLAVSGRALPYTFMRSLTLTGASLVMEYALVNTGTEPLAWLWAAHPQFTATAGTRLLLPDEVTELYNVRDLPEWGRWGTRFPYPITQDLRGNTVDLSRVADAHSRTCRKLYVPPEQPIAWAGLTDEDAGCTLRLRWNPDEVPYVGIWVDEGAVNTVSTLAIEISNGFHDSLVTAFEHGRVAWTQPGERTAWRVTVDT
jgi:hypothetical protein